MVYCTPEHRFGSDALLLARFCEPKRSQKAADLCSGCGIVALEWHDGGHRGPCAAVEQAPEASALLDAALAGQHLLYLVEGFLGRRGGLKQLGQEEGALFKGVPRKGGVGIQPKHARLREQGG